MKQCISERQSFESHLSIANIIEPVKKTGADAVHPWLVVLSENTDFAQACIDHNISFIGPTAPAIELMGSKRLSKIARVIQAGVPCVPGYEGDQQDIGILWLNRQRKLVSPMVKAWQVVVDVVMRLAPVGMDLLEALKPHVQKQKMPLVQVS